MESLFAPCILSYGIDLWDVYPQFEQNCVSLLVEICPNPKNNLTDAMRKILAKCLTFKGDSCKLTISLQTILDDSLPQISISQEFFFPLQIFWIEEFAKEIETDMLKTDHIRGGLISLIVHIKKK
jgi:hypothetical protein